MPELFRYTCSDGNVRSGSQTIRGSLCVPDAEGSFPLVITARGLRANYECSLAYVKELCPRGIAVYAFDFQSGSVSSRSDGDTKEMSGLP